MTFAEMTPEQRTGWLKWAWSHDWGQGAWYALDKGVVTMTGLIEWFTTREPDGSVRLYSFAASHTDLSELRAWAGY